MAALHTLVDTFHTLDATRWTFTAGRAFITAGRLEVTPGWVEDPDALSVTTRFGGEVWSTASWDARGSQLAVEVPAINGAGSGTTELGVFTASPRTNSLLWLAGFDSTSPWGYVLRAVRRVNGVQTVVATLRSDQQERRWLRIRENAGTAYWETSPDGYVWKTIGSAAANQDLSAVQVCMGTWYGSPADVSVSALFDSLNLDLTAGDPVTTTGEDGDPYLAVDVQPDNAVGTFRIGSSRIGGPDRIAWSTDDPATWVNVVCTVTAVNMRRGATRKQGLLTRTEAGTGTITVDDTTGQFDPNLTTAIRKGTPVRLRAWGTGVDGSRWDAVLFTGDLDTSVSQYTPGAEAPVVTLSLVDLVGPLAAWESEGDPGDGLGAGENLLQRAVRTLTTVGRGQVSAASSSAYTATLAPAKMAKPWDELQDATEAELGRMWVDRHNRLQLRARGSQPSGSVRGTLSDVHGEAPLGVHACMADALIASGGEDVANRVLGSRVALAADQAADTTPPVVRRENEQSQRLYGVTTANRVGQVMLQTDAQVADWAQALIVARARPELRVDSVTPRPSSSDLDSTLAQWPAVLGTDLGDRWLFRYHPPVGPPIIRGLAVLGIELDVSPDGWSVQWLTETAPVPGADNPSGWFVVGHSSVGGSDLLAPYAVTYSAA